MPGVNMASEFLNRAVPIFTEDGLAVLRDKAVAFAGLGGVGGGAFLALVRCGVRRFRLAENGVFDPPDMNRQAAAFGQTMGRPKLDVYVELARSINPDLKLECFPEGITKGNLDGFLAGGDVYVGVIDAEKGHDVKMMTPPLLQRHGLPMELGGIRPSSPEFTFWFGMLFYIPAIAGGAFGLLGGYLTDRFGRQRILTTSIMLYAISSFAAGFATNLPMLLVLRCLVFIGVCVEFVAAVAWLAEIFPEPRRREAVLGTTQAFSSVGGLLVALAAGIAASSTRGRPIEVFGWFTLPPMALPPIDIPHFLSFLGHIDNPHGEEFREPHSLDQASRHPG